MAAGSISLEPGGQFELSGAPLETVHDTCEEVHDHLRRCGKSATRWASASSASASRRLGRGPRRRSCPRGATGSWRPTWTEGPARPRHDVPLLHGAGESRLRLGSRHGEEAARVAGAAAGRHRAVRQFAVHSKASPTASSRFRSEIWLDTDPDRTGMLPFAFEEGFGFERYVDYALDVPMYFVFRDGHYINVAGESFRAFHGGQAAAAAGRAADAQGLGGPPDDDLPRGAAEAVPRDARRRSGPWRRLCALPALWIGLLYDDGRSMPPGTWSRTGPPRSARRCATRCRGEALKAQDRRPRCRTWRRTCWRCRGPGCERASRLQGQDRGPFLDVLDEIAEPAGPGPRNCWGFMTATGTATSRGCFAISRTDRYSAAIKDGRAFGDRLWAMCWARASTAPLPEIGLRARPISKVPRSGIPSSGVSSRIPGRRQISGIAPTARPLVTAAVRAPELAAE